MSSHFAPLDTFPRRHLGSDAEEIAAMCAAVGVSSPAELVAETVPATIRLARGLEDAVDRRAHV